jgi:4-hydroxy-3-methylbut-2-enyl diphosphate reductase IspH
VETAEDLDSEMLKEFSTVGVTAGASTPEFIIRSVCEKLENI